MFSKNIPKTKMFFDLVVNSLAENTFIVLQEGKPDRFEVYSRAQKLFDMKHNPPEQLIQIINHELNRIEDEK